LYFLPLANKDTHCYECERSQYNADAGL